MSTPFNLIKLAQSISELEAEARQIIARLGVKAASKDKRLQEIILLLQTKESPRAEAIADSLTSDLYSEELVPEQRSVEQVAQERGLREKHWSVVLLGELNKVAGSLKGKIISDIKSINTEPYKNCANASALRWVQYNAGRKGHGSIYANAIDTLANDTNPVFEMDDFFGYHPPIVATYYALHPEILKSISQSMYDRMLSYGISDVSEGVSSVQRVDLLKYRENILQNWGALSSNKGGIPLHWTSYRDESNSFFTFGQILIKDFTHRLSQQDPEAMCILFEKLYRHVTRLVSVEMSKAKGDRGAGEEGQDIVELGKSDFSSAQSELVGNEQRRQAMEANLQYALDESVFSNGTKSFVKQIEFLETYKSYFSSLLSVMDSSRDPESFKIILSLSNDVESAISNFVYQYVDSLTNAHKYSLEYRENKGITILDLSFDKMLKSNARKDGKHFIVKFSGSNGYVNINAKFIDNGKKIKKELVDISSGRLLGIFKELSLIEFDGLEIKISPKQMLSLTKQGDDNENDLLNSLGDVFEMYGELNTPAENKKLSQAVFQKPFYSVRPELIQHYQQQNAIPMLASICRGFFYEHPELIDKVIVGIKNTGSKSLSAQEKIIDWKKSFPNQYNTFESVYVLISNHLINKIRLLKEKVNLTDEAIECFYTIGNSALISEIEKLSVSLKTESDPDKRQAISDLIASHKEAQKVFDNLFIGLNQSGFKSEGSVDVDSKWLTSAIGSLWKDGEISNLIDSIEYKEKIIPEITSYINNLDDLQVIDLAATAYRGLTYNMTKKECMDILPKMRGILSKYGLESGDEKVAAIFSLLSSSCPIEAKPKTANSHFSYKYANVGNHIYEIKDWIKAFGRKTYTE